MFAVAPCCDGVQRLLVFADVLNLHWPSPIFSLLPLLLHQGRGRCGSIIILGKKGWEPFLRLLVRCRTSDHKHLELFWSKTLSLSLHSVWFTLTSSIKVNVIMYLKHSL